MLFLVFGFIGYVFGQNDGTQPNVVLFMADDLTYWDIGAYGGQAITPDIDEVQ